MKCLACTNWVSNDPTILPHCLCEDGRLSLSGGFGQSSLPCLPKCSHELCVSAFQSHVERVVHHENVSLAHFVRMILIFKNLKIFTNYYCDIKLLPDLSAFPPCYLLVSPFYIGQITLNFPKAGPLRTSSSDPLARCGKRDKSCPTPTNARIWSKSLPVPEPSGQKSYWYMLIWSVCENMQSICIVLEMSNVQEKGKLLLVLPVTWPPMPELWPRSRPLRPKRSQEAESGLASWPAPNHTWSHSSKFSYASHTIYKNLNLTAELMIRVRCSGSSLRQGCICDVSLRRPYGKRRLQVI